MTAECLDERKKTHEIEACVGRFLVICIGGNSTAGAQMPTAAEARLGVA